MFNGQVDTKEITSKIIKVDPKTSNKEKSLEIDYSAQSIRYSVCL